MKYEDGIKRERERREWKEIRFRQKQTPKSDKGRKKGENDRKRETENK